MPRIYDGVHYRNSTEVGTAMGKQIGKLAVSKYLLRHPNRTHKLAAEVWWKNISVFGASR